MQDLRARLPPSSEGLLYGEDRRQQAARWVALPLPLLLAAFLVHRYLCPAGLCTYMRAAGGRLRCRVGGHTNGSSSPSGSGTLLTSPGGVTLCSGCAAVGAAPVEGSGVLLAHGSSGNGSGAALRGALPPPALGPAAIAAGIACVLLSLVISTRIIIPSQVGAAEGSVAVTQLGPSSCGSDTLSICCSSGVQLGLSPVCTVAVLAGELNCRQSSLAMLFPHNTTCIAHRE